MMSGAHSIKIKKLTDVRSSKNKDSRYDNDQREKLHQRNPVTHDGCCAQRNQL
jgi:hypothetical protein